MLKHVPNLVHLKESKMKNPLNCHSTKLSTVGADAVGAHVYKEAEFSLTQLVGVLHRCGHPGVVVMVR